MSEEDLSWVKPLEVDEPHTMVPASEVEAPEGLVSSEVQPEEVAASEVGNAAAGVETPSED
jgi:hypothetical protein